MVAGLDIGNSTVVLCYFNEKQIGTEKIIWKTEEWTKQKLSSVLETKIPLVVSSVVKEKTEELLSIENEILWIEMRNDLGIDFSFYQSQMGSDRVATIIGASYCYPLPVCVVDMGTATTFSVADEKRIYRGGLILPGVGTMFKSLKTSTSLLGEESLDQKPDTLLALNTKNNIRNGIYSINRWGLEGIIQQIRKEFPGITIIGTGGWHNFFKECFDFCDSFLIFKGMQFIFYNKRSKN